MHCKTRHTGVGHRCSLCDLKLKKNKCFYLVLNKFGGVLTGKTEVYDNSSSTVSNFIASYT